MKIFWWLMKTNKSNLIILSSQPLWWIFKDIMQKVLKVFLEELLVNIIKNVISRTPDFLSNPTKSKTDPAHPCASWKPLAQGSVSYVCPPVNLCLCVFCQEAFSINLFPADAVAASIHLTTEAVIEPHTGDAAAAAAPEDGLLSVLFFGAHPGPSSIGGLPRAQWVCADWGEGGGTQKAARAFFFAHLEEAKRKPNKYLDCPLN